VIVLQYLGERPFLSFDDGWYIDAHSSPAFRAHRATAR
jgi:hypothetical protein